MFKNSVLGWLTLAAATFSLVSCNIDQELGNDLEEVTFTASQIDEPEATKSHYDQEELDYEWVAISWDQGDKVGVFGSWTRNAVFTAASTDYEPTFTGKVTLGDRLKYAYFPYSPSSTNYRAIPVTIKPNQVMSADGSTDGNDIKASNTIIKNGTKYDFQFQYLTSFLAMYFDLTELQGLQDDEVLERCSIQNLQGRTIAGDYSLNLTNLSMTPVNTDSKITLEFPSMPRVQDARISSVISLFPNIKRLDALGIELETNYHRIYCTYTAKGDYKAGMAYTISLDYASMAQRGSNSLTVERKDAAPQDPDHVYATKRELDWQNGAEFSIGGNMFSRSNNSLAEVYVPGELIVNDSRLQNSIVFVEPGATLFLGSNAKLGNTIIMSNDPDEKADVIGLMTAAASADPTYLALYDMNVMIPATVAGSGLNELYVEGCNINADNGTLIDLYDLGATTFGTLALVGNTFHPVDLMLPEFEFAAGAEDITFDNVSIKDNIFINVKGMGGSMLNAAKINSIDIQNNHFYFGSKLTSNFSVLSSDQQPASIVSKNNSYYAGYKGTGVLTSYETPASAGYMAGASKATLSVYEISEGLYEYTSNIYVGSAYTLDGETRPVTMTNKSATLPHVPSDANVEHFYLPGTTVSESGSWDTSKTVAFSTEDVTDTYTFTLPDYVAGPVQALTGDSSTWTLAWADEFNGSAWSSDAWSRIPVTSHGGIEYQNPDDASLVEMTDGALVTWAVGKNAGTYAAGGVYGKGKKNFNLNMNGVEGRIDVAVKVSDAQGFWPSIWMLPADQAIDAGSVANGEIDIFSHYHSENIVNQILSTAAGRYSCTPSYTDRDQYHVFTVTVTNEAINMYVDGALTKTVTKAAAGANGWPWDANEYYLNIAAQIGGWVGAPGANALPAHMDVDYVRYMVK